MLTNHLENKSTTMSPAPDLAILRERITRLRVQETREEQQLHAAQRDLTAAETGISGALFSEAKGYETQGREMLTSWMFAQSTAQKKILDAVDMLTKTRTELREASDALVVGEASAAAREAATLEGEIVSELTALSVEMLNYRTRCEKIQNLRERAFSSGALVTPSVLEALRHNWGEILNLAAVDERLQLIEKAVGLPEVVAKVICPILREKAYSFKAEQARGQTLAERHDALRQPEHFFGVEMGFNAEGTIFSRKVDY